MNNTTSLTEGKECKGGQNTKFQSAERPPAPKPLPGRNNGIWKNRPEFSMSDEDSNLTQMLSDLAEYEDMDGCKITAKYMREAVARIEELLRRIHIMNR